MRTGKACTSVSAIIVTMLIVVSGTITGAIFTPPPHRGNVVLDDLQDRSVEVGMWLNFTITAEDPDEDEIYFDLFSSREFVFWFDNLTGEFSYQAVEEDIGRIEIGVKVSDGNGSIDEGSFGIEVLHRNHPPDVEPIPVLEIPAGEWKLHQLRFGDRNGDTVTVTVQESDSPFAVTINSYFVLSFLPSSGQEGSYSALLNFSDNNGTWTLVTVHIKVIFINNPVEILQVGKQTVYLGEEFTYTVQVVDPDPDIITLEIEYSGMGSASVDGQGEISIIPDQADVGLQYVTIRADDNNGSKDTMSFQLEVISRNRAPEGSDMLEITARAGDIVTVPFDVSDPDGDDLAILPVGGPLPEWITLDEATTSMILTPGMECIGVTRFTLVFLDQNENRFSMDAVINVIEGQIPPCKLPAKLVIDERDVHILDLDFKYSGNGTKWFAVRGTFPISISKMDGSLLTLSPFDGDHGNYVLLISMGITNGTEIIDRPILVNVNMNLSTMWFNVEIQPLREVYDQGERVETKVRWGGYNASLDLNWVCETRGSIVWVGWGESLVYYVNLSGEWELYLTLGEGGVRVYTYQFHVRELENDETGLPMGRLIFFILIGLLLIAVLIWASFMAKKILGLNRKYHERIESDEIVVPDGFRSAPSIQSPLDSSPDLRPGAGLSGNHYTEGWESSAHDTPEP
ncbi:MAG: hypothetical protein ACMUHB_06410 [Thermoplasmatota archaeon]